MPIFFSGVCSDIQSRMLYCGNQASPQLLIIFVLQGLAAVSSAAAAGGASQRSGMTAISHSLAAAVTRPDLATMLCLCQHRAVCHFTL